MPTPHIGTLHQLARIILLVCVMCALLVLLMPTVSPDAEPTIEFNETSYEPNDTVRVKLTNLSDVKSDKILIYLISNQEESSIVKESINRTGLYHYTTKNTVYKLNQNSINHKINQSDIIYSNSPDGSGRIKNITVNQNKTVTIGLHNPSSQK
jgi:hypothetical protein